MKKQIQYLKLFLPVLLLITSFISSAQNQFTHIATKANNYCNANCTLLDIPELNNNPTAIIFVAPILENGLNLNPHPIGVYYFKNQWSIFNLDQRPIPEGAKFNVEYVAKPDSTHFQYLITRENLQKDGSAVIDFITINNPNAQLRFIPCWVPELHVAVVNRDEVNIQFNNETGKWYVSNINKKPLFARIAYNIIVSSGRSFASYKAVLIKELTVASNPIQVSGTVASMYMTVWADGIKLPGDNFQSGHLDQTQIYGLEIGASSPTTLTSGHLSTGKRIYEPITIKIHSGWPAGIPLLMAFTIDAISNDLNNTNASGAQALNYSIKLSGARIVSFKQSYEEVGLHMGTGTNKKVYDEIKIMVTKIEYTNSAGATAVDNL